MHHNAHVKQHTRDLLFGVAVLDRSKIVGWGALRAGIVTFAALVIPYLVGNQSLSVPLAVGVLFVGVADAGESVGRRWRTMLWATTWLMIATGLGGIGSTSMWLNLALAVVLSLVFGAAGLLGGRAGLIGLLSLVLFAVFSGAPESDRTIIVNVLMVGLGGLSITLVTVLPHLIANRGAFAVAMAPVTPMRERLVGQLTWDNQFVRHAARLCVVFTIATFISDLSSVPHDYWLPMTVAWVTKPDRDGTVSKIIARIAGTILGVIVIAVAFDVLHFVTLPAAILLSCASALAVAFIWANYAIAVTGVTALVVGLFTFDGDSVLDTLVTRILATVLAGVMVFAGTYLWRSKEEQSA